MLMTCRPTLGHIAPVLSLARAAAAAGHHVTVATHEAALPAIAAEGFAVAPAGGAIPAELGRTLAGPGGPPLETHRMVAFTRFFAGMEMEPRLLDLERIIRDLKPDVLVHEVAELAAPLAAAAAGLPLVTLGFGPLLDPAVADAVSGVVAGAWRARGLPEPRWGGLYHGLYLDPCPPALQVAGIGDLPAVQPMRTQDGAPGNGPDWLAEGTVYITFGTIFSARMAVFDAPVEAAARLGLPTLVTIGSDGDPGRFTDLPPSIRVERFVPQRDVLGKCAFVVCHGGAGTVLGALAFGVPLLVMPQGADQLFNGERCVNAGVGLMLRPAEASADAVQEAMSRLMCDQSFHERARAVAAEIEAMPDPAAAVNRIANLVA
jgi:UDP:flavonoid glycosyltransferase YjiC (YdhE family)